MKPTLNAFIVCLVLGSSMVLPVTANAQGKHDKLKSAAVGVAAYELAKHTGKNKAHKNFFQKHPVLTGVGAAILMHRHLKKKEKHH
jgi:hypothetical protein